MYKICVRCKKKKRLSSFYPFRSRGVNGYIAKCVDCCKDYYKERSQYAKNYHIDNADKIKEYQRNRRESAKKIVYSHYGNMCVCCGETNPIFLTLDHKNNDGYKFKTDNKGRTYSSYNRYNNIIKAGFPEDLQVLCFNCNCGRAINGGICPHNIQ